MRRRGIDLARSAPLIPGLLAIAAMLAMAADGGGFAPTSWMPAALFLLGLLVATVVGLRDRLPDLDRPTWAALLLLSAFTIWSFLSIAWAEVPADAWDGANRTLLYLIVFTIFTLPTWGSASAALAAGGYALAVATVGAAVMVALTGAENPGASFIDGRLVDPTGYQNATAALFLGAALIALTLAARREIPWQFRGLLLACAGFQLQLAILPQSRGASIVFPIALAALLALSPGRLRVLLATAIILIATFAVSDPLLGVFDAARPNSELDLFAAVDDAATAMAISFVALLVAGTALAALDANRRPPERLRARSELGARGALALGAVGLLVGALIAVGNPFSWAEERWDDFKSGYSEEQFASSRFDGGLGSNRYDFWRVGLGTPFGSSPLVGAGADNFAVDYLRDRESGEEPAYPHSLPVRVLAGTGLIGGLLITAFLVLVAARALSASRRAPPHDLGRAVIAGLSISALYWLMHSGGDWLWSFPALTAPAFAWIAISGRIGADGQPATGVVPGPLGRRPQVAFAACGILVACAALSLLLPWAAALDSKRATEEWVADPAGALERLDRASSLNPLSADPDLLAGTIATRERELATAEQRFERALEREPTNWYAMLELAAISSNDGDRAGAIPLLEDASSLNPADPLIAESLERARGGEVVGLGRIERQLLARVCGRLGRTDSTEFCED